MDKEDLGVETDMEPITANPKGAASLEGEDKTTVVPETEEETPESDAGKPESDGAERKDEPPETLEIYLDGEEDEEAPPPEDKTAWYKMRKAKQEADARADAAERKLASQVQQPEDGDPGKEPTQEDFLYDNEKYKEALFAWKERTEKHKQQQTRQAERAQAEQQAARAREHDYAMKRAALIPKFGLGGQQMYEEAERLVATTLPPGHQDVLMAVVGNSARVVYALGKRPEKLAELAKETNRDKFVASLVRLEMSMKERKKGTPPPPEEVPRGGGSPVKGSDAEMDAAEKRAEKSGDRSEIRAIQRRRKAEADSRR